MKTVQLEAPGRHSAGLDLTNLVQRLFLVQEPCRAVAFTGIEANNESASICMEAARVLAASAHEDVLVIDADFEHPGMGVSVSENKGLGLATALIAGDGTRRHSVQMKELNLFLMPTGPSLEKPFTANMMRDFIKKALIEFNYVLIHSPALASSPDCVTLAQAADGTVLVLEANKTRKDVAIMTVRELESAGATILGTVLNHTTYPIPDFLYKRL